LTKEGKVVCKHLLGKLPYTFAAKRAFIKDCILRKDEEYVPSGTINGKTTRAKKIKDPWSYIACDKATLLKLAPRFKWVERLLEYQKKTKLLSTYVEGIQERAQYGVLQGQFLQHGTTSGRYASRNPNMQNIPRDDKRIKNCLVARPGKSFVGSDFSQLEVRVFASVSGDENLLAAFKTGEDFYSKIGITVWGKYDATPYKDGSPDAFGVKYKKLRDQAKVIALASVYGATANRLSQATGKSIDDTQEDMERYFEAFPKIEEMMKKAHKTVKAQGYVTSVFGRPRRMPEAKKIDRLYGPNADLPYDLRKPLNLAVNHTIQSTAASICNRAMIKFYNDCKDLDINAKIVMQVHDEIIVEVDDSQAEDAALLLQNAMETAVELPGVAMEAIPHIGKNIGELK
jgi:DNA polymerase-1